MPAVDEQHRDLVSGLAEEAHEWISFEDGDGDTWLFDVTFLGSDWSCIWGAGCPGILPEPTPELGHGCCSYGAHFSDDDDRDRVLAASAGLEPALWQNHGRFPENELVELDPEGNPVSRVVDGACVFHNSADFAGGPGCALHLAAIAGGTRPLDWKPEVCWQLPLRLETHTDESGREVFTLREWKRRDWGEGGADFHWWCTEDATAFGSGTPVYVELADEIVALVGQAPYDALCVHLDNQRTVVMPHPATRPRTES